MAKKIGIIGGGQLGLMIAEEAHRQGALVYALDPAPDAPAFAECDGHIVAAYDDLGALEQLGDMTDVLTYEFENVPGDILRHLEGKYNIPQGIAPLFDSQDRLREKNNAKRHGLPVPDYVPLPACSSDEDCAEVPCELTDGQRREELSEAVKKVGIPCVLKTRRLGYDGYGQAVIREEKDIEKAAELLHVPCILEAFVPFDYECSVIMVRDGQKTIHFPIGRNIHKGGILDLCIVPAGTLYVAGNQSNPEQTPLCGRIVDACEKFMEGCDYRGILAIELFIKGNEFVFNEMAPRPHNSGHYTIEGCTSSQYTELCHFLLGKTLEQPELVAPTVMKNILGQDLEAAWKIIDTAHAEHWQNPAAVPVSNTAKGGKAYCGEAGKGVFVHIYGKTESRPKRKMAHITYVPMTQELFEKNWESKFVK
uniref:5-(carboxyamino)imidazole ribonucleotide synthase n=1 Tax=Candidatus Cryptobacteroides bacterium TaxID=3085639 RepID=UPI003FED9F64